MKNLLLTILAVMGCLTASAQWGSNPDGVEPVPQGTGEYGTDYVIGADGTIWFYYYHPTMNGYEQCLQAIDKNGYKKFGESGMVVSNYPNASYTVVNQYLCANSDSTVTMVVSDWRNSDEYDRCKSYTAYRIAPDGTQLWGEDGVNLDEGMQVDFVACMTFCELSDGSNAFAWQHTYGEGECVEIQRVSKEGECLYKLDDTRLCKTNGFFVYPYMVPSDNGSFIIVYGNTSSYYLRAMKFNANGTQAWSKATDIYKGGWGSVMSLQSRMKVYPGPDYGVVVTWNDDRYSDGWYSPCIAYIKKDGTSAFTNSEGKADIKLSYEEGMSAYPPAVTVAKDGSAFYCIFSQFNQGSQQWQEITIQKVNMNGEILWGDNGIQLKELQAEKSYGETSIQLGNDGQIGCFYEVFTDYHNVVNCLSIRNTEDGSAIDEENPEIVWRETAHYRANLESRYDYTDDSWLLYWEDDSVSCSVDSETGSKYFTKMNFDGTEWGSTEGIKDVTNNTNVNAYIYNLQGQRIVAPKQGEIYIRQGKKYMK